MQNKYRLYRRSSRANGTYYAQDCTTGARESLGTKCKAEAEKLLQGKNEANAQPVLSRELAKVYMQAQDPHFAERTWGDVARLIDSAYQGSTKERFKKFLKSQPVCSLMNKKLMVTNSSDFLEVFAHPKAGVSTNVQLRILHNRALDLEWILRPVLAKKAWPKIKYGHREGITKKQHEAVLKVTPNKEYRLYFELLWHTGGSQTDIAHLTAEDIDWGKRRLYYQRQKLESRGQGNACLVVGTALESVLKELPSEGPLFPGLGKLEEGRRSNYFWTKRVKAGLPDGVVLHSYSNTVLVTGANSLWSNSGTLAITSFGGSTLTVASGGTVAANGITLGYDMSTNNMALYVGGALNIGTLGGSDTNVALNTPTIAFGSGSTVTIALNFNQSDTATLTSAISGYGSINQLGSGTTILTASNSASGTLLVNSGTLLINGSLLGGGTATLSSGATLGGTGTLARDLTVASGGTLVASLKIFGQLTLPNQSTVGAVTSGTTTSPTDTQLLISSATGGTIYTAGGTASIGTLDGASLVLGNWGATVTNLISGSVTTAGSGLTAFQGNFTGSISGSGGLVKDGSGTLTLLTANSYTGPTIINSGVLEVGTGSFGSGEVFDNASLVFNSSNNLSLGNEITGNGTLTQIGAGTVTLTGSNSSVGATLVDGGTLVVTGSITSQGDTVVGQNGTSNSLVISNGGVVSVGENNYGAVIGLNVTSSNNSVLVTGTGSLWTNSGDLTVGYDGSSNSMVISNGGVVANGQWNSGGVIGLNADSSNNSVLITGSGSLWTNGGSLIVGNSGDGTLTVASDGSVAAINIVIAAQVGAVGTLNIGTLGGADTAGTIITPTIAFGRGTGTLNFNQSDSATINSSISGAGTIQQLGSGTTILSGSNSYTGTTTVNAGVLLVQNTNGWGVGAGILTVNTNGAVGGSGSIAASATIAGMLDPGLGSTNPTTLRFSTNLTLNNTAVTKVGVWSAVSSDTIQVGGSLNYGGLFDIALSNTNAPGTYQLFTTLTGGTNLTTTGSFGTVELTGLYGTWLLTNNSGTWTYGNSSDTYQFSQANGALIVSAVPEPATWALFGVSLLAVVGLHRGRGKRENIASGA